jgi:hypothetical protein
VATLATASGAAALLFPSVSQAILHGLQNGTFNKVMLFIRKGVTLAQFASVAGGDCASSSASV